MCCRVQVIALREVGLTYRDIAAKLHLSKTGVERIVQKYKETGALVNRSGHGKKYTTLQEDKQIVFISKRDRRKTASQIREEFNATRSKDSAASLTLIKDRLNESGLYGRIAAKKPLLRIVNKMKRLNWPKSTATGLQKNGKLFSSPTNQNLNFLEEKEEFMFVE